MKLNETIELNGKEYTVELNRESLIRIDQYVNMQNAKAIIEMPLNNDKSTQEIKDKEDPFATPIDEEKMEKTQKLKEETIISLYTRAFWIWLYPIEKLDYSEVVELLKPYLNDDTKSEYLAKKYEEFINKSVEIRTQYLEEQKNLKALTK
jgi:hypothetical protein